MSKSVYIEFMDGTYDEYNNVKRADEARNYFQIITEEGILIRFVVTNIKSIHEIKTSKNVTKTLLCEGKNKLRKQKYKQGVKIISIINRLRQEGSENEKDN